MERKQKTRVGVYFGLGGRLEVTSQLKQRDVITRGLSRPRSGGRDGRPVAAVKSNLLSEGEGGGQCDRMHERCRKSKNESEIV